MSSDHLCYFVLNRNKRTARCKFYPDGIKNLCIYSAKSKTNLKSHLESCQKCDVKAKKEAMKYSTPFSRSVIDGEDQAKIMDAVIDYVSNDDQPVSLVEKPSFRKFMPWIKPSWKPIA